MQARFVSWSWLTGGLSSCRRPIAPPCHPASNPLNCLLLRYCSGGDGWVKGGNWLAIRCPKAVPVRTVDDLLPERNRIRHRYLRNADTSCRE